MSLRFWMWAIAEAWKSGFRAGRMSKLWKAPKRRAVSTTARESSKS